MKECTRCKIQQPLGNFRVRSNGRIISMCDGCRRKSQQASYYKHHQTNLDRTKNNKINYKTWYNRIKEKLSCCICGENDPSCLDFHHLDVGEKEINVGELRSSGKQKLIEEINKCSCVCANCHRKIHAGKIVDGLVKLNFDIPEFDLRYTKKNKHISPSSNE